MVNYVRCSGLNPSTHYAISVYARNKLGDGEYSSNVSAITDGSCHLYIYVAEYSAVFITSSILAD